jgi:hypothetical protein
MSNIKSWIQSSHQDSPWPGLGKNHQPMHFILLVVSGEAGGLWQLKMLASGWKLLEKPETILSGEITMSPSTAWKLFTKGISIEDARQLVDVSGDETLASHCLQMVSVMATR